MWLFLHWMFFFCSKVTGLIFRFWLCFIMKLATLKFKVSNEFLTWILSLAKIRLPTLHFQIALGCTCSEYRGVCRHLGNSKHTSSIEMAILLILRNKYPFLLQKESYIQNQNLKKFFLVL